ncbi:MAG: hypothetical protein WC773_02745 [Patescibacteria group bacterium]
MLTGELEISRHVQRVHDWPEVQRRISAIAQFVDVYLDHQGTCHEVRRGLGYPNRLTVASLLPKRFVDYDFNASIVHVAAHSMYNMALCFALDINGQQPSHYADYAYSSPDTDYGNLYRYFWLVDVGNWLGAMETKMTACVAMMIAVLEGNPIAEGLTRVHWEMVHEDLGPLDLTQSPWRELLVKPG